MAVYRHPRGDLTEAAVRAIADQVPDTVDSIILGDFNAHNSTWNCELTTPSGEALHDTMLDRGFFCINTDTKSRVGLRGQRDSNIDLAFGSASIMDKAIYEQEDDTWDSDHYPISFTVDSNLQPYRKITNRITSKRTDWSAYYGLVDKAVKQELLPFIDAFPENTDLYYKQFIDILKSSIDQASGRRKNPAPPDNKNKKYKVQHRWWDADCDKAIQDRKKAFSTFKRCKSLSTWDNYKRACALVRRTVAAKKRACFEEFCAGINRFTSLTYVWNTMKILKNARSNVRWNSWNTKNREDEIRKSVDKLAPPFVGSNPMPVNIDYRDDSLSDAFQRAELDRAITMIKKNSAPGLDGIEYRMIEELPDSALECLLALFNCIWLSDSLPEDWLHYQVVFIDKPGKEKVRPISLSSCVGKLCERMINERLTWWAESSQKFNPAQNGFRRGKSCADNLVKIVSDIRTSISTGEYTLAAFLDVSGAYDNVEFRTMIETLVALNCPAGIVRFIRKWLYRRLVRFIVNSQEFIERLVYMGLPQGAVLSPPLYSLYTGRVCTDLPEGVQSGEFADDIGLYICGPNRQRNKELLQLAVNLVAERLRSIGLDLEPLKTVIVEFNKYGMYNENQSMLIQGCEVFYSHESKFLGIWLDNGLKFSHQIREVRSKVDRANSVIRYLCRVSKGLEVNTALMLYKSLVRSITDYGSFVYHPRDANSVLKLERTQYKGIRTALGYRNSTPNNVIVAEAKIRLLVDRAEMLARNYIYKAMAQNLDGVCDRIRRAYDAELWMRYRQPTYNMSLISRVWKKCSPAGPFIGPPRVHGTFQGEYEAHTFVPTVDFTIGLTRKHDKEYSDAAMIEDTIKHYQINEEAEIVFTDGSRGPDWPSTGASIVIDGQDTAYKISMPKVCSSYTAEIFAINATLKLMKSTRETRNKHIVIMSDCKSALTAIRNNHISVHKNKYVVETRLLIYTLEREYGMKIVLVWIPAHIGIAGNELADGLAKEAAQESPDESIEVPIGDYMAVAREETWQATQASIKRDSTHKGKFYFSKFYEEEARKPWFNKINAERYYVTLINRIRADHYNLGSSLFRKNYIDTQRCECGHECEDLMHVILQCHKYDELRIKLDEDLRAVGYLAEIDVYEMIKNRNWNLLYYVFEFLKDTGKII